MPADEPGLLRLILAVHDAAAEPSLWPHFLADYARATGADAALIQRHELDEHRSEILAATGLRAPSARTYTDHYSRLNVWREHGRRLYAPGRIVFDQQMYPRDLLKRTEFYNDFLLPAIGSTHSMAGVIDVRGQSVLNLTALRRDQKEGWQGRESPIVAALLPHLVRAKRTEERLALLEAGDAVLNGLDAGVIFLDDRGEMLRANGTAERVLAAGDGLSRRHRRLVAADAAANTAIERLVAAAIGPGLYPVAPPDVLVPRLSGLRPYHVAAAPLRRRLRPFLGMAAPVAYALVTDPERSRPIGAEMLRQGYGLTKTEARLALALGAGDTVAQAADRLAMRYETARTHLRRLLSKTDTSRQADLVRLLERLARGAAPWSEDR